MTNTTKARLCVLFSWLIGLSVFVSPWVFGFVVEGTHKKLVLAGILGPTTVLNVLAFYFGRGGAAPIARAFALLNLGGGLFLLVMTFLGSMIAIR